MPTIDNWRALREALASGLTARELASAGHAGSLGRLLAERDRLESDATNCQQLVWALARELKCLPSIFSDANGHVLKAAIALNEERDRLAAEVEALRADAARLLPEVITEEMHVAACKVLLRSDGLDGTQQRMLNAMRDAARGIKGDRHSNASQDDLGAVGWTLQTR